MLLDLMSEQVDYCFIGSFNHAAWRASVTPLICISTTKRINYLDACYDYVLYYGHHCHGIVQNEHHKIVNNIGNVCTLPKAINVLPRRETAHK